MDRCCALGMGKSGILRRLLDRMRRESISFAADALDAIPTTTEGETMSTTETITIDQMVAHQAERVAWLEARWDAIVTLGFAHTIPIAIEREILATLQRLRDDGK